MVVANENVVEGVCVRGLWFVIYIVVWGSASQCSKAKREPPVLETTPGAQDICV